MICGKKYCIQKLKKSSKKNSFRTLIKTRYTLAKKSPIKYAFHTWNRRSFCMTSQKAGLTLEAAVIIPLFLFFFLGMVYIIYAISLEVSVKESLYKTGKELAKYAYLTQVGEEYSNDAEDYFGAGAFAFAATKFCSYQGKEFWDKSVIKDGSRGFSFLQSVFLDEEGVIDLVVHYDVKIPFLLVGEISFPQVQRCRIRGWIGAVEADDKGQEEMVYITSSGTVYHRDLDCQHLKISIRSVLPANLPSKRNRSGGKYYPCSLCGKKELKNGVYYLTDEGDRFHTMKSCSGLKRNIMTIPLSEAGGRSACKRCGGVYE